MPTYRTERLVQQLNTLPGFAERFLADREAVFEEREIPENERAALRDGTPPALANIGLHPVLQIHFFIGTRSPAASRLSGVLLDRLGR